MRSWNSIAIVAGIALSSYGLGSRLSAGERGTWSVERGAVSTLDAQRSTLPTASGQAAFGAIAEVVRLLEADSTTDWSKVNIEALRQHLIDMDEVTMRAEIVQRAVSGGIEADISGRGRTLASIQRLVVNQSRMLDMSPEFTSVATVTPTGAHVVVTAKRASDARTVSRIRGLGYAGLMTEGDHHTRHHMALARGDQGAHMH
jgi:hypothetical protein